MRAAQLLNRHGAIESFPPRILGDRRELALLFKRLATLRDDAALFDSVEDLHWRGPAKALEAWAANAGAERLVERCRKAVAARA
jgi:hypothetical protein